MESLCHGSEYIVEHTCESEVVYLESTGLACINAGDAKRKFCLKCESTESSDTGVKTLSVNTDILSTIDTEGSP